MQKKQRFVADQRWDKSHYDAMMGLLEGYFQQINMGLISPTNRIVGGWEIIDNGGLQVKIDQAANSYLLVTERVGFENLQVLLTSDTALTLTLPDDDVSYVEVQFDSTTSGNETVAIWDPLAAGGTGLEFTQAIDTVDEQIASLVSNVSGFTGDANKLPLATVTTVGGSITVIDADQREFLWAAATYNFGVPRTDKDISSIRDMYDAITTIIKQDHNKTNWYDPQPASIDVFKYDVVVGDDSEVAVGDATHTASDFVAGIDTDGYRVFILDGVHTLERDEDIGAGGTIHDLLIDFESGNAIIDFNDGIQRTLTFSGDRNRIQFMGDTITADDIIISGDFNSLKTWLTNSTVDPIDDTGTGNSWEFFRVS